MAVLDGGRVLVSEIVAVRPLPKKLGRCRRAEYAAAALDGGRVAIGRGTMGRATALWLRHATLPGPAVGPAMGLTCRLGGSAGCLA